VAIELTGELSGASIEAGESAVGKLQQRRSSDEATVKDLSAE